jgi:hypothetical protein
MKRIVYGSRRHGFVNRYSEECHELLYVFCSLSKTRDERGKDAVRRCMALFPSSFFENFNDFGSTLLFFTLGTIRAVNSALVL